MRQKLKLWGAVVAAVALAGLIQPLSFDEDPEAETMFLAPTPAPDDSFGIDVAIEGGRILVGSMRAHGPGLEAGRAYLIQPAGDGLWRQEVLVAPESSPFDFFGSRVALTSEALLVGAHRSDAVAPDAGAVYMFEKNITGLWEATLLSPSDAEAGSTFGTDIVAEDDRILVGASQDRGAGAAYLFERADDGGWTETKIVASDAQSGDGFGTAVGFLGDGFIVTAIGREFQRGIAYVYQPDGAGGWTETRLQPEGLEPYNNYGKSVSVSGDSFAIGAPFKTGYQLWPGSVYVYEPDGAGGWASTRLDPSDYAYGDWPIHFGYQIVLDDGTLLVGAPFHDVGSRYSNTGAVYVFEDEGAAGWSERIVTADNPRSRSGFGISIAKEGPSFVVGAPHGIGAVYLYGAGCVTGTAGVPPMPSLACDSPLGDA